MTSPWSGLTIRCELHRRHGPPLREVGPLLTGAEPDLDAKELSVFGIRENEEPRLFLIREQPWGLPYHL